MIVPAGADTFAEGLRVGVEVFQTLKALLHERGLPTAVGDEGGFAPDLPESEEAIRVIMEAAERAGHADRIAIALDPAATEIWRDGAYRFEGRVASPDELIDYWEGLCDRYPIVSLEDPMNVLRASTSPPSHARPSPGLRNSGGSPILGRASIKARRRAGSSPRSTGR